MPTYEHLCEACDNEWEDIYKISDPIPTQCPKCKKKGEVKRLISSCQGRVELSGYEYKAKIKEDVLKMSKSMLKDENKLANFVGESKYHDNELRRNK
jgi:putative FmdB family regulatory protein